MSQPAGGRTAPPRDQHESGFTSILHELVLRVPGARAAVLVDRDGESVDYWGRIDPYDLKLAAAHWRIVLNDVRDQKALGTAAFIVIRASRKSFVVQALPDDYALVIVLSRAAGFVGWRRAVPACARALAHEAGWEWAGARPAKWYPVRVVSDALRKPAALVTSEGSKPLTILGTVVSGVVSRERGWRVRFDTGLEATLVREPGGSWYVDDLDETHHGGPEKKSR